MIYLRVGNISKSKNPNRSWGFYLVPGQGFEPRYPGPKPGVLPLDDPGIGIPEKGDLLACGCAPPYTVPFSTVQSGARRAPKSHPFSEIPR